MQNIIIGIDISSKTLDICLKQEKLIEYYKIENTQKSIRKFFKSYQEEKLIVAMENTGRYNWELYDVLPEFNFTVFVINPLHLSKSQGLVRGKNDKEDSYRITLFTEKNKEDLSPWMPSSLAIRKIKVLMTERNARIKTKRRLIKQKNDYKKMRTLGLTQSLTNWNLQQIHQLDKQIKKIEELIQQTIDLEPELKKQQKLMLSVPGVGKVVSWTMIAKTEGFKKITNPRKMACYSGVVPFEYQSGTSVYRKPRVSMFADKQMKSILHLAAMSAIRLENDLQVYYRRKVKQGKNKMAVLNAVRNKIIHLIFAIIKSENLYQNRLVTS
ncbi:IS110 family RNA-guided transposase [Wenyingzhuangia aestuarii]|uniref:IS110 family transposase n=1 Tax=Wenyingzhuangia aestuarii TaxID=1647582 RepID=UPI001438AD37|nr:IS110 family transposase [Wenyingzhuangia aestuarii]NJB83752.1 transposase [Wenyingzhuangia aestuarii]